jgi:hypothetical protein
MLALETGILVHSVKVAGEDSQVDLSLPFFWPLLSWPGSERAIIGEDIEFLALVILLYVRVASSFYKEELDLAMSRPAHL